MDMAEYGVEPRATEHRCQCCGEIAEGAFCDDCIAHMDGEAKSAEEEVGAPRGI